MFLTKLLLLFLIFTSVSPGRDQCFGWRTTRSGDSCWQILQEYRYLNMHTLQNFNPGLNCDKLFVGQKLCVAKHAIRAILPCNKYATVQPGDTCYKFWSSQGISEGQFKSANREINCDRLQIGQRICLSH